MTQEQLIEAMDMQVPVYGETIMYGEIEYEKITAVILRRGDCPGTHKVSAELQSKTSDKSVAIYPAHRIRAKENKDDAARVR